MSISTTEAPQIAAISTTEKPELAYSATGESYTFDSLGELLDELAGDFSSAELLGQEYFVGEKVRYTPGFFFRAAAERLIDNARDHAFDVADEWSEDFAANVSKEAKDELDALVQVWADKHLECRFFTVNNTRRLNITAKDLA